MSAPTLWTPEQDSQIVVMRQAGESWGAVARMLGLSRDAVVGRGRTLGLQRPSAELDLARAMAKLAVHDDDEDADREPYPPGHPIPWGTICAGLQVLAGAAYVR